MASHRILLAEDSSTTRRMPALLLEAEGYEVRTAVDGADGLAKVGEAPRPELIPTDHETPELDGPGLCRAVKADGDLAGDESGADEVIRKPHNPGDVQERFARVRAQF